MTVQVDSIVKSYGARRTIVGVRSVSFAAADQGITSLVGPSGSGKSTLLRLVAGLEIPDAGRVLIDDVDVTATPVRERGVGFVFQGYALFKHMSVFDNIAFGLRVRGRPKSEIHDRVGELLDLVRLADHQRRFPDQLSGGQRQRVALARALAPRPRVLLLDEPFGALDAHVRLDLREWLRSFHEQTRVTTIMVTHDQEEALELSESVVVLRSGSIEQAGAPHELFENPRNDFVASFLGGGKVLRGRVAGGRALFGASTVAATANLADGTEVATVARPHDLNVSKFEGTSGDERVARVDRLVRVGGFVKLSILLPSGESIVAQMPWRELAKRGIQRGDSVLIELPEVHLAQTHDYVI